VPGRAVDEGDLEAVAWLLRQGADPSGYDGAGVTLLMRARGNADMVRLLLADGADLNARDGKGQTALMRAGAWPDVVTQLLQRGANAEAKDAQGRTAFDFFPPGSPAAQLLLDWRQARAK
jgi:ankyrin repeat protein